MEPKPIFVLLAHYTISHTIEPIDPNVLADKYQEFASRCREETIKRALIESAEDLNGRTAQITRNRLERSLPHMMRTLAIENAIIKVGSYAAQIPELWDLIYPK